MVCVLGDTASAAVLINTEQEGFSPLAPQPPLLIITTYMTWSYNQQVIRK